MSIPTLSELFSVLTRDQIVASVLKIATQVGLPESAWQPISVGREIITILCQQMADYNSGSSTQAAAAGLLDFATDEWLTLTANQVYGVDRIAATFAAGAQVQQITNKGNQNYNFNVGDVRFLNTVSGATYVNTSAGSIAPYSGSGPFPTLFLDVQAERSGSFGSAPAGAISDFVSPLAGLETTNVFALVGVDEESDAALRTRARESVAAPSPNGPVDAYSFFAKSTTRSDGTNCGVTRVTIGQPVAQPGTLIVYLASDSGPVASSDVALVQTNILANCTPTGIVPTAVSAAEFDVGVNATIYLAQNSTLNAATVRSDVLAALSTFFKSLPIGGVELTRGAGGFIFIDALISTIFSAEPAGAIVNVVITNFSNDVSLAANQVAVLTSTVDSFTVVVTT